MINALPNNLKVLIGQIQKIIDSWPVKVSLDHAVKWVMQFDAEHYPLAVRILENIDILDSYSIRSSLEVAHTKLIRKISEKGSPMDKTNTLFAAIGNTAKSGSLIAYHYRTTVGLSEKDFVSNEDEDKLDLSKIDNIVLVDDVIGSGKTIANEVKRVAEEVYSLSRTRNLFVLTVAGYEDGIKRVIEETGATVVTALEYGSKDTVADLDGVFYRDMPFSERNASLEIIKKYCRVVSSSTLGYSELGGLLAFDHNTPNTTLPIIWSNSKGWLPLFPRATFIRGVAKILKSANEERKSSVTSDEITLFVEGRVDELFIDCFISNKALQAKINVVDLKVISLGGLYHSEKLMELLKESRKQAIFIVDNDDWTNKAIKRFEHFKNAHILQLKPNFISLLDIDKIYANKERFKGLPDQTLMSDEGRWWRDFEQAVIKKHLNSTNNEIIIQVIDEFLGDEKYEAFCKELLAKKNEMLKSLGKK
jgi:hypothetical protein